jgi:hypothetical protein
MKRTARLAVCVVAAVAFVGVGTDAQALGGHRHARHHHTRIEHDGSPRVLHALGRLDRRLERATRDRRLAPLSDADRAALQTNVTVDEAAVEAAATAYSVDPTAASLAAAKDLLRSYHADRYVVATNILRHSRRTAIAISTLQVLVVPGSDDDTALATASGLLAGAPASGFTATMTRARLHAARRAVAQARALVGQVRADLATD